MQTFVSKKTAVVLLVLLLLSAGVLSALAGTGSSKSDAAVYWAWDFNSGNTSNPIGASELIRSPNGIEARYATSGLTPGNAMTLWFIVFNYPEQCAAGAYLCTPADLGDTPAQGDFLVAAGHVIGGNVFAGSLNAGDNGGSGLAEVLGCEDCTPGLIEPESALVLLAVHDHGPAQSGDVLKAQISSYLGGCVGPFNGDEFGFATGPGDLPDAVGECSTTQFSAHAP